MKRSNLLLTVALIVSVIGNLYLYRQWSDKAAEVPYWSQHQPLIDKAINLFASEHPTPTDPATAMRNRFPIATMVPDPQDDDRYLICVTLKLRRGMLGFTPIYCFDDQGKLRSRSRV